MLYRKVLLGLIIPIILLSGCYNDHSGGKFQKADGSQLVVDGKLITEYPSAWHCRGSRIPWVRYVFKLNHSKKYVVIKKEKYTDAAQIEQVWECGSAVDYPDRKSKYEKAHWRNIFKKWERTGNAPNRIKQLAHEGKIFLE